MTTLILALVVLPFAFTIVASLVFHKLDQRWENPRK